MYSSPHTNAMPVMDNLPILCGNWHDFIIANSSVASLSWMSIKNDLGDSVAAICGFQRIMHSSQYPFVYLVGPALPIRFLCNKGGCALRGSARRDSALFLYRFVGI